MVSAKKESGSETQAAVELNRGTLPTPLLATKLYRPPVTPDLEPRTRLIERLERSRQRPLTLVSAPAGYGKTMLASMWLESCGCPSMWVSLDKGDNDLLTFTSYLLTAVHNAFPEISLKTRALLEAPTLPQAPVLARYLLNDLDQIHQSYLLALDDLHRIQAQAVFELLDELLQHPPPSMHLVLVGRHDPPLQIASLRARGQVTEIRAQDLRFTPQETAGLLSYLLDRQVDLAIAAEWAQRTEGWVTALRLAALSLRHRGRADASGVSVQGDSRYLRDYLLAEVLAHQPDAIQAWLLKSAFLDRFCAPLCEAVCQTDTDLPQTGDAHLSGDAFIDWLERENLFLVPLDDRGEWFRFHHLFQQLLQDMLQSRVSPGELAALRTRASNWYAENGLVDEALQYALKAGDVRTAVHLVEQHRYELMNTEQWSRLDRWLKLLPAQVVMNNPFLMSTKAHIDTYRGQDMEIISSLQRAEQLLTDLIPGSVVYETVKSEIAVINAIVDVVELRPTQAIQRAQSSLERLPQQALHMRVMAIGTLAIGLQMQGDLEQGNAVIRDALAEHAWPEGLHAKMMQYLCTVSLYESDLLDALSSAGTALRIVERLALPETLSFCRYHLGIAHYLRNELTQAEPALLALLEDRFTSAPLYLANGGYVLALIYQAQDRMAEAAQVINLLEDHFQETNHTHALAFIQAFRVELALRNGNLTKAEFLSKSAELNQRLPIWFFYVPQLTPVKLLLAEGTEVNLDEARARLDALDEGMRKINRKNVRLDVLALLALVCAAQGDEPAAFEKLYAALALAEKGGAIRNFVDLGAPMANLLLRLKEQEASREYAQYIEQILTAFPQEVRAIQAFELATDRMAFQALQMPLIEPLTRRELQILNLLAQDLSMQEIADELVISINTVYTHAKNIYAKLGVTKRSQAVQQARVFDLV